MRRPCWHLFGDGCGRRLAAGPEPEAKWRRTGPPRSRAQERIDPAYTVKDGDKVDPKTLMGWKTWRNGLRALSRAEQGRVSSAPALVNSLKSSPRSSSTHDHGRPAREGHAALQASKMGAGKTGKTCMPI